MRVRIILMDLEIDVSMFPSMILMRWRGDRKRTYPLVALGGHSAVYVDACNGMLRYVSKRASANASMCRKKPVSSTRSGKGQMRWSEARVDRFLSRRKPGVSGRRAASPADGRGSIQAHERLRQ